jgi:DNA-binding beta-propeller fold protein YncE/phospholipase C
MRTLAVICLLTAAAVFLASQSPGPREQVGPLADGGFLLNSGWKLKPAGRQVQLDTFPMASALSKDGKYLLVLYGVYKAPSISVLKVDTMQETSRIPVTDGWLGLTFAPDGKHVYVGGGSQACVYEFSWTDGKLEAARTFRIVAEDKRAHTDFIGDVAVSPDGHMLYAAGLYQNAIHVINLQSGRPIEKFATGRRPYRILVHPDSKSYFVTSWADGSLYHHNAVNGERLEVVRLGQHPTDIVWRPRKASENTEEQAKWTGRLFIPAANTNTVYAVGVSESKSLQRIESINVAMTSRQPAGMTPTALAMNADQSQLFVVCSDANAAAVVDISEPSSSVLGFVPTGWYPTAARSLADGRLVVLNGRGLRSLPNPKGPNPTVRPAPLHLGGTIVEYVGRLQTGTASVIDPLNEEALANYSKTVLSNSGYRDEQLDRVEIPSGNPVPARPGDPSPIQHVIYIVKENRTYDQVLGDLGKGNGDPSLTLFHEKASPNHHKLAREFVLFDNFYVNADVSADGHNWSSSAIANDYVQKMWPNSYAGRRKHYDYEGGEPAALPPAGYLWTNAAAAGISIRNYGWWATNLPKPTQGERQVERLRDPLLAKYTNMNYRAFDLDYMDIDRAKVFISDLQEFEKTGTMPKLMFLRLGNDHTSGTAAGKIAPLSAMADNDAALGMIVEAVSKSKFWPQTAIFVLEDDAQNGPDHVDSHRSPAFILSPYTRRDGFIDSSMYNTTSMLRTMELIAGLRPMTVFDAAARPMWNAFSAKPDTRPYAAEPARIPLDERNPALSATAARSARLDFSEADLIDDDELNDILWRAIRKSEPPAPVRSYFSR